VTGDGGGAAAAADDDDETQLLMCGRQQYLETFLTAGASGRAV